MVMEKIQGKQKQNKTKTTKKLKILLIAKILDLIKAPLRFRIFLIYTSLLLVKKLGAFNYFQLMSLLSN